MERCPGLPVRLFARDKLIYKDNQPKVIKEYMVALPGIIFNELKQGPAAIYEIIPGNVPVCFYLDVDMSQAKPDHVLSGAAINLLEGLDVPQHAALRVIRAPFTADELACYPKRMQSMLMSTVSKLLKIPSASLTAKWMDGSRPDGSKFSMHAVFDILLDCAKTSGKALATDVALSITMLASRFVKAFSAEKPDWEREMPKEIAFYLRCLTLHRLNSDNVGTSFLWVQDCETSY